MNTTWTEQDEATLRELTERKMRFTDEAKEPLQKIVSDLWLGSTHSTGVTVNRLIEHAAELRDALAPFDLRTPVPGGPETSPILEWLEDMHNLHTKVEALYVVNGYQVSLCWDDEPLHVFEDETLRGAYLKAMAAFPRYENRRFVPAAER